jgi:hypothetical protein
MKISTFWIARVARQLSERLAHEPRLETDVRVAHLALDLGLRHECRHRVDDDDVDGAAAHEHVGDFEGLLAVSGCEMSRLSMSTPSLRA